MTAELSEPEQIVWMLAERPTLWRHKQDVWECLICHSESDVRFPLHDHSPACPFRRAVEWRASNQAQRV